MANNLDKAIDLILESMERVRDLNDSEASENEKMTIDQAKAIADLGGRVIDGYKVKAQVLKTISKSEMPEFVRDVAVNSGINKQLE